MELADKPKTTPKDFFLWLGGMVALYVSVISLITLFFQVINYSFPDPLQNVYYSDPYSGPLRFAIASLIVIFPLYLFLTRLLNNDLRRNPEKKELWVRRWLIYLTLFVAGITLVVDLIALINTFLEGEITTRFILKVIAIFGVVGFGFLYYLLDLKGRWEEKARQSVLIGWIAGALVLASIVGGFLIIGSPASQRLYRFDDQKISELQNIQSQVVNYWQLKKKLPLSLADLEDPLYGFSVPQDSQTNTPYVYRITDKLSFELCATFNKESRSSASTAIRPVYPSGGIVDENWTHEAGEQCFIRTIDPERFPPVQKLIQ